MEIQRRILTGLIWCRIEITSHTGIYGWIPAWRMLNRSNQSGDVRDITYGSEDIIIAVIDSGIISTHLMPLLVTDFPPMPSNTASTPDSHSSS